MARKKRKKVLEKEEPMLTTPFNVVLDKDEAEVKIGNEYLPKGVKVKVLKVDGDIAYVKYQDRVYQIGVSSLTLSRAQEVNK